MINQRNLTLLDMNQLLGSDKSVTDCAFHDSASLACAAYSALHSTLILLEEADLTNPYLNTKELAKGLHFLVNLTQVSHELHTNANGYASELKTV